MSRTSGHPHRRGLAIRGATALGAILVAATTAAGTVATGSSLTPTDAPPPLAADAPDLAHLAPDSPDLAPDSPGSAPEPADAALPDRVPPIGRGFGVPGPRQVASPAWMRRLSPGERPPQFVVFSFDGVGSHTHWQRMLSIATRVGAHFTGFLSGIYLLSDDQRERYRGPGHPAGRASIGFGGSPDEVAVRVADLNRAVADGHEIGTHYNGHFCTGAEPSVGAWSTAQWDAELDQFFDFVRHAPGLRLDPAAIVGGRTPCLEGRWDQAVPAMRAHGFRYDSSRPSNGIVWPTETDGFWEFWMPTFVVPALHRRVIMMDYNLWYAFNQVRNQPARAEEFARRTLDTYRGAYQAAASGNRAPLVVANHFNDWSGGAFSTATEQFMAEVCQAPDTVCATYTQVIDWMALQDPGVLAAYRNRQPAS